MQALASLPGHVPVLIVGGGPVGLSLAAMLAAQGVASLTMEADDGYCGGSRATCISRRSQEILGWIGADVSLVEKGLGWTGGRSYFGNTEVLHFHMPNDPLQRYAPMINIQQYYVEEYAHDAMRRHGDLARISWSSRVVGVKSGSPAEVTVEHAGKTSVVKADWVVACDGGRSTVRELLGLSLRGTQYEGRYVIVDIEQESQRPIERLAWFDPPSNPGSTILMHRQPENVWRVDYQIGADEDPAEAVKPENVLPRVQSHLDMIGETAPWKPLWISSYNAKCLTLDSYRHGHVLFAGDAAHLVPIFGVRGLNSGFDDAGNLAWKLAWIVRGDAPDSLLDSYNVERVHATRQNIAYGSKSTEFMAPPDYGFRLLRDATLRLALKNDDVRELINPRQGAPISYDGSPLNQRDGAVSCGGAAAPGQPAPEALLAYQGRLMHLTSLFGRGFVAMAFGKVDDLHLLQDALEKTRTHSAPLSLLHMDSAGNAEDAHGQLRARYGAHSGVVYVMRPDGYVLGRWQSAGAGAEAVRALAAFYPTLA